VKLKLDTAVVHDVKWGKGGTEATGVYKTT
jgi:hypothetical protein